ncbi:MAG: hypothetical protein DSY89_01295 [Deltaproteobacteria bacterium]|nr:MAG: hypothetical protein DSY89_01295 [Deltaproteobacteria bacterium]
MTGFAALLLFFIVLVPGLTARATGPQARYSPSPSSVKLHDIKDVIPLPAPFPWGYWLGGGLLLLLGLALAFWIIKRRKKEKSMPSAGEQALAALDSAGSLMDRMQSRAFAVKVAEVLRTYIEKRFQLFRPGLTTREFLQALTRQPETKITPLLEHDTLLREWLNHCDMAKFAHYPLTHEDMEQMLAQVREFIETTAEPDTPEKGRQGE